MSDKLDWLNQHVVLFLHDSVAEAAEAEQLSLSTELEKISRIFPRSEEFLEELDRQEKYKEACSFLGYNMHRRASVWWAYLCTVDLMLELKIKPAEKRDISDIGKPRPLHIPDWAKEPEKAEDPAAAEKLKNDIADMDKSVAELDEAIKQIVPQEILDTVDEIKDIFWGELRKEYGKDPEELMKDLASQDPRQKVEVDFENSPMTKAAEELHARIEQTRQKTIRQIKEALGTPDTVKINAEKSSAIDAVYAYIVSPDETNAADCLAAGNKIPDQPEGLLALCAFWSFGNMSPLGENVVKTPAGLFGNGICSLLLMLALSEGGTCEFAERFKKYCRIGFMTAIGRSNWTESVKNNMAPHKELLQSNEIKALQEIFASDDSGDSPDGMNFNPGDAGPAVSRFRG